MAKSNFELLDKAVQEFNKSYILEMQDLTEDMESHKTIISKIPVEDLYKDPCFDKVNSVLEPLLSSLETEKAGLKVVQDLLLDAQNQLKEISSNPDFITANIAYKESLDAAYVLREKFTKRIRQRIAKINSILETYRSNEDFMRLVSELKTDKKGKKKLPFYTGILARFSNFWTEYAKTQRLQDMRSSLEGYLRREDHFGLETIKNNHSNYIRENFNDYNDIKSVLVPNLATQCDEKIVAVKKLEERISKAKNKRAEIFKNYSASNLFTCSPSFRAYRELEAEQVVLNQQHKTLGQRAQQLKDDMIFCRIFSTKNNVVLPDDTQDLLLMYLSNSQITKETLFSALCADYKSLLNFHIRVVPTRPNPHDVRKTIHISVK